MTDRYYFKCTWCERSFACECPREDVEAIRSANCPLCNEATVRVMGKVEKSNIVREVKKSACDRRCTDSQGPSCNCKCNCLNHGTGKLVIFNKIVGKLAVVNAEMLDNNEVHIQRIKRMAEAKNRIKVKVLAFLDFKFKDAIIAIKTHSYSDWKICQQYDRYRELKRQIDKLEDFKSIQRKVNTLAKMIPRIGTNLEYLEALYDKQQEKVA